MKYTITIVKEIETDGMKKALDIAQWIVKNMPVDVDYTDVRKVENNE